MRGEFCHKKKFRSRKGLISSDKSKLNLKDDLEVLYEDASLEISDEDRDQVIRGILEILVKKVGLNEKHKGKGRE